MAKHRSPFRINVGFLISGQIGTSRDFDFSIPQINLNSDLALENLEGVIKVSRTPQGLLVEAHFQAYTAADCVRCLETFPLLLQWDFTEMYAFSRKKSGQEGLLVPMDGYLDLGDLVNDYAVLAVPMKPVCSPNCQGLCPVCGANLNETQCGHEIVEPQPESPFAALKDLLDE